MSKRARSGKGPKRSASTGISRRQFAKRLAVGTAVGAASQIGFFPGTAVAAGRPIRVGLVSPRTGPMAALSFSEQPIIDALKPVFEKGVVIAGTRHPIQIALKDSQSSPNRAAEVASDLILNQEVDLILSWKTPETTNPVADQAELNETPCLTTMTPWQPYFFGRGGKPDTPFKWTYHFFWGLEDIIAAFTDMWGALPTNKTVGALWPNDGDGVVWADRKIGWPPVLEKQGFKLVDPGRFKPLSDDFTAQISEFKSRNVEIVTGVLVPPDFATFWTQSHEQGFRPKAASFGKAYLFPNQVEALGRIGVGLTNEVFWTPSFPTKSSLTGETSRQVGDGYIEKTGKQWDQLIGNTHALFEVALDALSRTSKLGDRPALVEAIGNTSLDTLVGRVDFSKGPVKNVAKQPLVGGQWVKGDRFPVDLKVVSNERFPNIPTDGELQPIKW